MRPTVPTGEALEQLLATYDIVFVDYDWSLNESNTA